MAKMTISESRLHELIQESIYEVLQEAQYDEGIGHFLGNLWQSAKNKWNNFKGDFNAGRNKARYDNRDYDSYSHYGDEGNEFRNFGGQEYGAHRYNTTVDRNAGARQWTRQRYGDEGMPYPNQGGGRTNTPPQSSQNPNPSPTQVQGHPGLGGGQQTPQTPQSTPAAPQQTQQQAPAAPQQTQQQAPAAQPQRETQPMNGRQNPVNPNDTAVNNKAAWEAKMKKLGLVNKGSVQRPQWHNVNGGKLTPDQKNAIQQWSRFKLNEQKKELDRLIKEIKSRKK